MADEKIGAYSPETAKMILDVVKYLQSRGLVSRDNLTPQLQEPTPYRIFFGNDSFETIPPYALMQIDSTVERYGKTYHVVNKYNTGRFGGLLFNGKREVLSGETGMAQTGISFIAKSDGGSASFGQLWGPVNNSWTIGKNGGPFMGLGNTDVGDHVTNTIRVMHDYAQTYRAIATSTITARVGRTDGSGTVTLLTIGPGSTTATLQTSVSVTSLLSDVILVGAELVVARTTNGRLQVIAEDCADEASDRSP